MKLFKLPICGAGALILALASTTSRAQTAPSKVLVFTEESSSVLTATVDGLSFGTVTFNSADHWIWTLPPDRPFTDSPVEPLVFWTEPEDPSRHNVVAIENFSGTVGSTGGFGIASDNDFLPGGTVPLANKSVAIDAFTFVYVNGSTETFSVQFIDNRDTGQVPDSGSSLGMLLLSAAGMFGVGRLRAVGKS
jgi:hypothetical protein